MMAFAFEIPGIPVPCGRPRGRSRAQPSGKSFVQMYQPAATRDYQAIVRFWGMTARRSFGSMPPDGVSRFELSVKVHRVRKIGDGDNFLKNIADGLTGVFWEDDRQVVKWTAELFVDKANPRCEVLIRVLPSESKTASAISRGRKKKRPSDG